MDNTIIGYTLIAVTFGLPVLVLIVDVIYCMITGKHIINRLGNDN